MKKILIITFALITAQATFAQNWIKDFNLAKEVASKNDKPIILVFSGSDWCAPCMKLEKNIFDTEEFKHYATKNYVLLKADFPQRKKNKLSKELQEHNNQLAEKYNQNGFFPLVVVLNSNGDVMGNIGYKNIDVRSYIDKINAHIK